MRARMPVFWRKWIEFWSKEQSLSALLLMLVLVTLVLPPLNLTSDRNSVLGDEIFSVLLITGVAASWSERGLVVRIVTTMAVAALCARWLTRLMPAGAFAGWKFAIDILALVAFALVVLAKVVRPGTVTGHRIQGAVAVYLLFGLVWAHAYEWTAITKPGAFAGAVGTSAGNASWIYYSFVTLTTMGYGDITPVHPFARSLAAAEALTGQLYIAILISRLVALEIASRPRF